jgi:hypothetical protein
MGSWSSVLAVKTEKTVPGIRSKLGELKGQKEELGQIYFKFL